MKYPKFIRVIRKRYGSLVKNGKVKNSSGSDILKNLLLNKKSTIISTNIPVAVEVIVYFDGPVSNIYQIQQWVRAFTLLNKKHRMLIIARHRPSYEWIIGNTEIPVIYLRSIDELQSFYDSNSHIQAILYVNHAFKNFQSLINNNALHVHINHGESDKTSTTTNQVKAYDRVFIVAQAAYDKYAKNLFEADMDKFVMIGRPQLDGVEMLNRPSASEDKKIILYAPTWEGTHQSMNYSSIQLYGEIIVHAVMNNPDYYIIYRPHPRTGTRDPAFDVINKRLISIIKSHELGHVDIVSDSLSLCELAELAIFDNSAVAVDYLKYNKPFLLTDLFSNQDGTRVDQPIITKAAKLIDEKTIGNIRQIIDDEFTNDSMAEDRSYVRQQFIGNYDEGESTQLFIEEITKLIELRDSLEIIRSKSSKM